MLKGSTEITYKGRKYGQLYHSSNGYVFMTPEAKHMIHFTPLAIRAMAHGSWNVHSGEEPSEAMTVEEKAGKGKFKWMGHGKEAHVYKLRLEKPGKRLEDRRKTIAVKFYKTDPEWESPFAHKGIAQAVSLMQAKEHTIETKDYKVTVKPLTPLFVMSDGRKRHMIAYKEVVNTQDLKELIDVHPQLQLSVVKLAKVIQAWNAAKDHLILTQGFGEVKMRNMIVEDYDFDGPQVMLKLRFADIYHPTSPITHLVHDHVNKLFPITQREHEE